MGSTHNSPQQNASLRLSLLDRANAVVGESESDTLRGVIAHAQQAEKLGFTRFFTAEHHAVPGLPGSQPAQLATAVGAATESIRIGTAGIMLTAHQPLIVAEQIAMLEALYPGRVDAGIGNSVGFTTPVRDALRQPNDQKALAELKKQYPDELREVLSYLDGTAPVTARPFNDGRTPVWLLAGFRSLFIAAELGLPAIMGGISPGAIDAYFENFQPSSRAAEPTLALSRSIAVADTEEQARDLLLPEVWAQVLSKSTGTFDGLQQVEDLHEDELTAQERKRIAEQLKVAIYGTPAQVKRQLQEVLSGTDGRVGEIVVTGGMSDHEGRRRSEQLLAEIAAEL